MYSRFKFLKSLNVSFLGSLAISSYLARANWPFNSLNNEWKFISCSIERKSFNFFCNNRDYRHLQCCSTSCKYIFWNLFEQSFLLISHIIWYIFFCYSICSRKSSYFLCQKPVLLYIFVVKSEYSFFCYIFAFLFIFEAGLQLFH